MVAYKVAEAKTQRVLQKTGSAALKRKGLTRQLWWRTELDELEDRKQVDLGRAEHAGQSRLIWEVAATRYAAAVQNSAISLVGMAGFTSARLWAHWVNG